MNDNRSVSKQFLEAFLEKGALSPFLAKVKEKNSGLQLRFRGNNTPEAVTIYYNNHVVWKISRYARGYKIEVSANHVKGLQRSELLEKLQQEPLCFITKSEHAKSYPYVVKNSFDDYFVNSTYNIMVGAIKEYFGSRKYREKRIQQELFETLTESQDGLYVYDLEFKQKNNKLENEPDMLAVRYSGGEPQAIVLIEVKSKWKACEDGKSGLTKHLEGMKLYINESPYLNNRKQEAHDIISAYKGLKLHNPPKNVPDPEDLNNFEMMIILTDSAVDYYKEHEGIINMHIQGNNYNCKIVEWTERKTQRLLFDNQK
ncbi:hypothetical protein SAMN05216349_12362 [Oribacterium sp. KHPX15]|uniref:hypothetical protein n=1 Tax=Oribacterium sp. KHPX15 TaxID=1855342 RepID=UPI0008976049|nr:hypothetical protein [Oribacterium sp. KHPX15]SEA70459.1 hypothetical protein SAMN05216349_12362 [Oribacterium sp. KHPX15]